MWIPQLACLWKDCALRGSKDEGNVRFKRRYGAQPSQLLFRCTSCNHCFSLRKGTALFHAKISEEDFYLITRALGEGNGVNEAARITEHRPDTVAYVRERVGKHCERVLTHHVREMNPGEVQLDEIWSFNGKKEGHLTAEEAGRTDRGDCWGWFAFDPDCKVVLGFVLGKRTKARCVRMLKRVHEVLVAWCQPLFTSDQLPTYKEAIIRVFGKVVHPVRKGARGRHPKPRRVPHEGLLYAVVHKVYKKNRVVRVEQRVILGDEAAVRERLAASKVSGKVNTSFIERMNGKLRAGVAFLRRKTLGFSKSVRPMRRGLCLTIGYDHFCRYHLGLRQRRLGRPPKSGERWHERTPMMAAGKTDHRWSVEELALHHVYGRGARCPFGTGG